MFWFKRNQLNGYFSNNCLKHSYLCTWIRFLSHLFKVIHFSTFETYYCLKGGKPANIFIFSKYSIFPLTNNVHSFCSTRWRNQWSVCAVQNTISTIVLNVGDIANSWDWKLLFSSKKGKLYSCWTICYK